VADTKSSETEAPDATTLLKQDHREVEDLFKQFQKAEGSAAKKTIADKICAALIVHTRIENEIFYPACEGKVDKADLNEAYVEHDSATVLIGEIAAGNPSDEFYDAKVKVLQEEIEHHVKEEEQWFTGIFAEAKRHGLDEDKVGAEMFAAKTKYMAEIEKNGLPKVTLTTMEHTKVS
jgi:Hemerythrin HHE cation binding domain